MKLQTHVLILFLLASTALIISGYSFGHNLNSEQLFLVIWCGWSGTYAIYGIGGIFLNFQDFIDFCANRRKHILPFLFVFQLLFILPILSWVYLPRSTFWTLTLVLLFGYFYSLPIKMGKTVFVLKRILLIKNLSIGISWGALVLVGTGKVELSNESWFLFLFVSSHIFLGSILRDHFDLKQDSQHKLLTLPMYLGEKKSYQVLHLLNVLTFALFWYFLPINNFLTIIFILTLYKSFIFIGAKLNSSKALWTQTLNIGFNFLVLILVLIYK